jgi:MFS family permease
MDRLSRSSARLSLGFSCVGHTYVHLFTGLYLTAVLFLEDEFGRSYGELLSLWTLGAFLYGAGSLPAGWLGDRWSTTGMMILYFFGIGAGAVLVGLAATPIQVGLGLAALGLAASIYHPVGMAWLVRNAERRGRALGVNGVFGSLGAALAASVVSFAAAMVGWRAAFIVPGAISVVTGLLLLALWRTGRVTDDRGADRHAAAAPAPSQMLRAFVVLSLTMLASGLVYTAVEVAMPKAFALRLTGLIGGETVNVGWYVTAVFLAAGGAQLVGGHLADRYSMRRVYILSFVIQVPLLALAATLIEVPLLLAVMAVMMLGAGARPSENGLLAAYSPDNWRATAFGAKFLLSIGIAPGAIWLVGSLYDRTGEFVTLFVALAAAATAGAVAALMLPGEAPPRPVRAAAAAD